MIIYKNLKPAKSIEEQLINPTKKQFTIMETKHENQENLQKIEDKLGQLMGLVDGLICMGITYGSENKSGYSGESVSGSFERLGELVGEVHKELDESLAELFKSI